MRHKINKEAFERIFRSSMAYRRNVIEKHIGEKPERSIENIACLTYKNLLGVATRSHWLVELESWVPKADKWTGTKDFPSKEMWKELMWSGPGERETVKSLATDKIQKEVKDSTRRELEKEYDKSSLFTLCEKYFDWLASELQFGRRPDKKEIKEFIEKGSVWG